MNHPFQIFYSESRGRFVLAEEKGGNEGLHIHKELLAQSMDGREREATTYLKENKLI